MIFEHLDYKEFANAYFDSLPKGGRGQYTKLANFLSVSTVVVSQTLKGDRELSAENAYKVTKFLGLNQLETQYFLKLVEYSKASYHELKSFLLSELKAMQKESKKVKSRYNKTHELSDEDKFQFYSDRFYSAIRMASSLPHMNTIEDFSKYFHLSMEKTEEIVDFLIKTKLCVIEDGKIKRGIQNTFVPASSPYIKNHHRNWRLNSIEKIDKLNLENELMYTAPLSLSKEAYQQLRTNLLKTIQDTVKMIGPTEDEMIACMNIDLLML